MESVFAFLQYFGATTEKLPSIVIQGNDEKKYILEKAHTANIRQWLKDYFVSTDIVLVKFYKLLNHVSDVECYYTIVYLQVN